MRTELLSTVCALFATLTLSAPEAHAQRRRPRDPGPSATPEPTAAPEPSAAPSPAPSATPAPASAGGTGAAPAAGTGGAPAVQTILSNVINRPGYHVTRPQFEVFASVGPGAWAWPFGGFLLSPGMRLGFPLTRNGPIAGLNNDFRLLIGAQLYFSVVPSPYFWLSAPVTLQWNFFLSDQWSVLLEGGLAVDVFVYDFLNCYDHPQLYCDRVLFHPAAAFGLRRHWYRAGQPPGFPAISFRFTYPGGVQVALEF